MMHRWATEFRAFLLRRNLVDLAVAIVIGVALIIGRRGISGLAGLLWRGEQEPAGAEG
jgi:hypothetical protein